MKKCGSMVWVLGLLSVFTATEGKAFVEPQGGYLPFRALENGDSVGVGIKVIRPRLKAGQHNLLSDGSSSVQVDAKNGSARVISGENLGSFASLEQSSEPQDYIELAKQYVATHSEMLGVSPQDLVLNDNATLIDDDVQFVSFKVEKDGTEIQDSNLAFRFKFGKLIQVVNQTFGEVETLTEESLAATTLEEAAKAPLLAQTAVFRGERFRVEEEATGYVLHRVSEFDVTAQDGQRFVVQVIKATGKVFELRPTQFYLNGSAQGSIYGRYYKDSENKAPYSDLTLTYNGGSIKTDTEGNFSGAPSAAQPKIDGFMGSLIRVNTRTGAKVTQVGLPARGGWDIVFQKGDAVNYEDKAMAQSMAFYHLNRQVQHAKKYIKAAWLDKTLSANVNLAQTCNAYWDGSTVNMFSAGGGCANTALIADVLYHEWGHGLDDNTGGIEDGAYSEGFGDIVSLIMTNSNVLGIGFRTTNGSPVRDLTNLKVYPKDANQEVHAEGLIIGGTFWDLFNNLKGKHGAEKATDLLAKYAYKSVFTATKYTDVYDAVLVIDDDNGNLKDKTPNFCHINKAFARHGLATADTSCK